jgi:hypothetical protein
MNTNMPRTAQAVKTPRQPEMAEYEGGGFKVTKRVIYTIEMPEGALDALASVVGHQNDDEMLPHEQRARRDFLAAAEDIRFSS